MKHHRMLVIATAALVSVPLAVGIAVATPPSGVTPTAHVVGAVLPDRVNVNADRIRLQTKEPVEVSVVTLSVEPGGTTGWHSHPGLAVIAVAEGTGKLYSADCSSQTFHAGQAFVETGDDRPTDFRNESAEPVVLTVTFLAPQGAPLLHDEENPGCVAG